MDRDRAGLSTPGSPAGGASRPHPVLAVRALEAPETSRHLDPLRVMGSPNCASHSPVDLVVGPSTT